MAEHLVDLQQISHDVCATGDTDVIISVRACNLNELYNFVIETLGKVPGVRHTQIYPLPLNTRNNAAGRVRKLGR